MIERLTEVRGIGRWTVEMLLIFTLGRPDVLPVTDLGIRKGFQLAYGMKRLPAVCPRCDRAGRSWAPYRSVASLVLVAGRGYTHMIRSRGPTHVHSLPSMRELHMLIVLENVLTPEEFGACPPGKVEQAQYVPGASHRRRGLQDP